MTRRETAASQFMNVLERVIATLDAENAALRDRQPCQIVEFHARKSLALYELELLGNSSGPGSVGLLERLGRVRTLLDENHTLLRLNVSALGEVLETMHRHEQGEDSDGTYCANSLSGARPR